jgi:hypothetical protein
MKRKQTLRGLKKKAWRIFSEYIRRRDTDEGGTVRCVTCRGLFFWKEVHAGHFVPGRTNAVLFHEDITNPQCPVCNIWKGGAYQEYTLYMLDKYGREKVDEFLALKRKVVKYTRSDLEDLILHYEEKLAALDLKRAA